MAAIRFSIIDFTTLVSGSPTTTIIDEPVGLDRVTLHMARDKDYHGFADMIDDSLGKLSFYGESYSILQTAYQNHGIDAHLECLIEFACDDDDAYQTLYTGRFSMDSFTQNEGIEGCYAECIIKNSYDLTVFRSRIGQKVSLDSVQTFDDLDESGNPYPPLTPYEALGKSIRLLPMLIRQLDYGTIDTPVIGSNIYCIDSTGNGFLQPNTGGTGNFPTFYDVTASPREGSSDQNEFNITNSPFSVNPFVNIRSQEIIGTFPGPVGDEFPGYTVPGPVGTSYDTLPTGTPIFTFKPDITFVNNIVKIDIEQSFAYFNGSPDGNDSGPNEITVWIGKGQTWNDAMLGRGAYCDLSGKQGGTYGIGGSPLNTISGGTIYYNGPGGYSDQLWNTIYIHNKVYDSSTPEIKFYQNQFSFHASVWFNPDDNLYIYFTTTKTGGSDLQLVFYSDTYSYRNSYMPSRTYPGTGTPFTLCKQVNASDVTMPSTSGTTPSIPVINGAGLPVTQPQSYLRLTFNSVYNSNDSITYLINEALSRTAEIITNNQFKVYSDYFGRTDAQPYASGADGPGALLAISNGLVLRGYSPLQAYLMGYTSFTLASQPETFTSYTLNHSDTPDGSNTSIIRITNPAGTTIIIPSNSSVSYQVGTQLLIQEGTGKAMVTPATGVVIYAPSGQYSTYGPGSLLLLTKVGEDVWLLASRSSMFVSFKDLINALNSVHTAGFALEPDPARSGFQRIRVEPLEHFYDSSTVMLTCENVNKIETTANREDCISEFEIGFSKWEAEQAQGLDDFLSKRTFRTTLNSLRNKWNKVCSWIASGYAIEQTRRKLGTNTTDWRYDKDNFLICVERRTGTQATVGAIGTSGGHILSIGLSAGGSGYLDDSPPAITILGTGGIGSGATAIANMANGSITSITVTNGGSGYTTSVNVSIPPPPALQSEMGGFLGEALGVASNGLIDPSSVFNARISPIRNALRWLKWILPSYPDPSTGKLIFAEGDGNYYAFGKLAINPIEAAELHENETLSLSDYAASPSIVYKNETVKFSYPLGFSQWLSVYNLKYGLIKYNVNNGSWRYGYLQEMKYDLFTGMVEFTLKSAVL